MTKPDNQMTICGLARYMHASIMQANEKKDHKVNAAFECFEPTIPQLVCDFVIFDL